MKVYPSLKFTHVLSVEYFNLKPEDAHESLPFFLIQKFTFCGKSAAWKSTWKCTLYRNSKIFFLWKILLDFLQNKDTRECSLSNQIHTLREKFEELKDIHRNIILLSPWIFEDSFERGDNGNIKMIPQLIAFDECPKSISLISDAPVWLKDVKNFRIWNILFMNIWEYLNVLMWYLH